MVRIVAIDGPAGSGKSSVSKAVARKLGFGYLDTGAAYRALALAVAEGKCDLSNGFTGFDYEISLDPNDFWVKSYDVDVTEAIRSSAISSTVSKVAGIPEVRSWMKQFTRTLALESGLAGVVIEGRDITTVVFPDAQARILLTASEEARLARRAGELTPAEMETLSQQVLERDAKDSKVVEFQTPAEGVTLVDTTNLNFEESIQAVLDLIEGSAK
jgi:cytidylate kinase